MPFSTKVLIIISIFTIFFELYRCDTAKSKATSPHVFPIHKRTNGLASMTTVRPEEWDGAKIIWTCPVPSPEPVAPFQWSSWESIPDRPSLCTLPGNILAQQPSPYSSYLSQTLDTQNQQLNDHKTIQGLQNNCLSTIEQDNIVSTAERVPTLSCSHLSCKRAPS